MAELTILKEEFISQRVLFVNGERMVKILRGLNATTEDLEKIRRVSDDLPVDPTLPFRRSKNGRFMFDLENDQVRRLEFQPFLLSAEEDFVRHDSGQVRRFEEIGDELQLNSALKALLIFKAFMFRDVHVQERPKLDYQAKDFICTLFNLRTVTTPDLVGEPALEGVHSDGVDFTMTTFLGSENMTADSAITFVHDNRQKNSARWNEADPTLRLCQHQHRHFLDTLLFMDHERKHSLSPVEAADKQKPSTRDMLIFFTRKPLLPGHPSHEYDSLRSHTDLPMVVGLNV